MQKISLILLLLFFCIPVFGQPIPEDGIRIPYSADITIDGDNSDWKKVPVYSFDISGQKEPYRNKINASICWDENSLYFLFNIEDKQLYKRIMGHDNPNLFLNDAVEIYIDTKSDSKGRMDLNDYQFIVDIQGESVIFKGEKSLISQADIYVPKDAGTANIIFDTKTKINGTLNDSSDTDQGWICEIAIPFAAIGIKPQEGIKFTFDLCADDRDSYNLRKEDSTAVNGAAGLFSFRSLAGSIDFGYPNQWIKAEIVGHPDFITILTRRFERSWLILFVLTFVISVSTVTYLYLRIRKLKQMPEKKDIAETPLSGVINADIHPEEVSIETKEEIKKLPHQKMFDNARIYIEQNMDNNVKAEDLAKHLALGLRQVQRIFREELNTTPTNFITLIKLEKAAQLMKEEGQNVTEAAYSTGFNDSSYFSRVFKNYFGVPPKEYAKQ